ncbi:MAG: hypothetical protein P0Y56_11280 [Candidatus Andeanibacterium colombiense]|uniref:Terminase n=1 Tax=Candidatus Andeanibacterium colombiense TaxID=3121345 RepID=A0AAJ6BN61_9SPHN|nr:MAG: hypothetical protein P0Y56_11280 [Sphingomonadaceae bacterium]
MTQPTPSSGRAPARAWKRPFLEALAESSNVARAAKIAEVPSATVYDLRRKSREFARQWQAALSEGYDNLEMELLGRLREGEIKRAAGAKVGVRTFDNATAYRLLMVHKDARDKERATRANVTAAEVRASIERKVAVLKAQVEARAEAEAEAAAEADGE